MSNGSHFPGKKLPEYCGIRHAVASDCTESKFLHGSKVGLTGMWERTFVSWSTLLVGQHCWDPKREG